jgi:hypothetical protein
LLKNIKIIANEMTSKKAYQESRSRKISEQKPRTPQLLCEVLDRVKGEFFRNLYYIAVQHHCRTIVLYAENSRMSINILIRNTNILAR